MHLNVNYSFQYIEVKQDPPINRDVKFNERISVFVYGKIDPGTGTRNTIFLEEIDSHTDTVVYTTFEKCLNILNMGFIISPMQMDEKLFFTKLLSLVKLYNDEYKFIRENANNRILKIFESEDAPSILFMAEKSIRKKLKLERIDDVEIYEKEEYLSNLFKEKLISIGNKNLLNNYTEKEKNNISKIDDLLIEVSNKKNLTLVTNCCDIKEYNLYINDLVENIFDNIY